MEAGASKVLRAHLTEGKLMQLATVSPQGIPWLCHVWYAVDEDLDLIFTSKATRRHSGEIRASGRVAGGIVGIPLEGLGQKVQGVTFEGEATETSGQSLRRAYSTYATRWPQFAHMVALADIEAEVGESRLYRIRPSTYVVFDELAFPGEPRQELKSW